MTQVVDTDCHIFEKDEDIFEYLEPPYRGRKELFAYPFFPPPDGFHRMFRRIIDQRPFVIAPDDPETWLAVLDGEAIERTVIYPTGGLGVGFIQDRDWVVVVCRAYNNMMADRYINFHPRLGVVAVLPTKISKNLLRYAVTRSGSSVRRSTLRKWI